VNEEQDNAPEPDVPSEAAADRESEASAADETAATASAETSDSSAASEDAVTPDPEAAAEEPAADQVGEEDPAAAEPEPVASEEAPPEPAAEEAAEEPVAAEPPADAPVAPQAPAEEPVAAEAPAAEAREPVAEEEADEIEVAPRVKPEIPGADLIPDIVTDEEQFLDAEAQAAAEAEAEAAAAAEEDQEVEAQPIADAAIDLAAGARYTATGKRKTAVARVILKPGTGSYSINGRPLERMFPRDTLQRVIRQPLEAVGYEARMDVVARMHGGGVAAQAGALRHGISRALLEADPNLRGELKRRGYLTRDPRVKERKKAGLKKARKRPQFSKR